MKVRPPLLKVVSDCLKLTVTPDEGANVEHIKRKALDMVSIVERHLRDR
jgi:hypothetical protein